MKNFLSQLFLSACDSAQQQEAQDRPPLALEALEQRDLPSATYLTLVNVPGYNASTGAQNYDQINFQYKGQGGSFAGVQLGIAVSSTPTVPANTPATFYGFCVDITHSISLGSPYQANPTSASSLPNGAAVAWLYDTYNPQVSSYQVGTSQYKTAAAALQLAIWEKEYGVAFSLVSVSDLGNGGADVTGNVSALAATYLKSVPSNPTLQATYYDATLGGTVTNGEQGVIGPPPTPVAHGATATMGYWHNKNGQALINSFNGGPTSTALGNWLASNFPNLFGSFAGQNNSQIAADFLTAFGNVGGVQGNTYAQTFAVALAVYATDPGLGGGPAAAAQGFTVKTGGTGAEIYNVGSNGAAFGVPNGTSLTVSQILQTLNANYNPTTHLFYGGSQTLTSAANNVTNGINQSGDIS